MLLSAFGFRWEPGYLVFLGAFFTVLTIIAAVLVASTVKTRAALENDGVEGIRWNRNFHDLPLSRRYCRHHFTGELEGRICECGFDCRNCSAHDRLVAEAANEASAEIDPEGPERPPRYVFGFDMQPDLLYHRGHTWVRLLDDGTATIGLDDLGSRLVGEPDEIVLPAEGTSIRANGTGWRFIKGSTEVRVLSPVDATVLETGGPKQGWFLKVKLSEERLDLRHLMTGLEIGPWILKEIECLQRLLSPEAVGVNLADGGTPVPDFTRGNSNLDWNAIWGEMFLQS